MHWEEMDDLPYVHIVLPRSLLSSAVPNIFVLGIRTFIVRMDHAQ